MSWAHEEMAGVQLGDGRLNRRAPKLLETLGSKPTLSIPAACRGWDETLAAYRFFDQERVSAETILSPHAECTLQRARQHPVVLAIQDTSELDFTGKSDIEGLGPLTYETQRGLHVHPTLMVTPERVPLGVFDAWIWARDPETFGQDTSHLPIEDKESVRWLEGYQRVNEITDELAHTQLVYVADREGDIYELFVEADQTEGSRAELLIRANHDRCLENGKHLRQSVEQAPILGEVTFTLPKTPKRPAREVTQTLRATRVTIKAPDGKAKRQRAVTVTAVLAKEPKPPKGQKPVHWLLLTTLPVETFEQAVEKMHWYLCRWQIELLFKILKSGCKVEELQLEHIQRLEPAIAFYLIIAWRVLLLTMTGRNCPDMPCEVVFETKEWKAIYLVSQKAPPPDEPPPLDTIVRMLAGFGGFLNRKGDGFPGIQSLWVGLQRTRDFVLALTAQNAAGISGYV